MIDRVEQRESGFGIQIKSQKFKVEIRRMKNEKIFSKNRRMLKKKLTGYEEEEENIKYVTKSRKFKNKK